MVIKMKLKNEEFNKILNNEKNIEVRLADCKRKRMKVGDSIEFTNITNGEKVLVDIEEIVCFRRFIELYNFYSEKCFGTKVNESLKNIYKIYSIEEEIKYGVLAIKFKRR